jgi:hypothetical protein
VEFGKHTKNHKGSPHTLAARENLGLKPANSPALSSTSRYARLIEEIEKEKARERMSAGGIEAGRGRPKSEKKVVELGPQPIREKTTRDIVGGKIGMAGRTYRTGAVVGRTNQGSG